MFLCFAPFFDQVDSEWYEVLLGCFFERFKPGNLEEGIAHIRSNRFVLIRNVERIISDSTEFIDCIQLMAQLVNITQVIPQDVIDFVKALPGDHPEIWQQRGQLIIDIIKKSTTKPEDFLMRLQLGVEMLPIKALENVQELFPYFISASPEDQYDVFPRIAKYRASAFRKYYIFELVMLLNQVPRSLRTSVLEMAESFSIIRTQEGVQTIYHDHMFILFIRNFCGMIIEESDLSDVTARVRALIKNGFTFLENFSAIFRVLRAIPPEERSDVIAFSKCFCVPGTNLEVFSFWAAMIRKIPSISRQKVIDMAVKYKPSQGTLGDYLSFCQAMIKFPVDDLEPLLLYCSNIQPLGHGRVLGQVLNSLLNIPKEERTKRLEQAIDFLTQIEGEDIPGFISELSKLTIKDSAKFIGIMVPFLKKAATSVRKLHVVTLVSMLPQEQWTTSSIEVCINYLGDPYFPKQLFTFLPSNMLLRALETLNQLPKRSSNIFDDLPIDIIRIMYEYLCDCLDKAHHNPEKAYQLACRIIEAMETLKLVEEHIVMQKAIDVYIMFRPEILKGPQNHFEIYTNLKNLNESLVECTLPSKEGLRMDIKRMRELCNEQALNFKELPTVNRKLLRTLLDGLNNAKDRSVKIREHLAAYGLRI